MTSLCVVVVMMKNAEILTVLMHQQKVLVIPGGLGCPDQLRRYPACLKLIKEVHDAGGVIGFICHGAWVAISAKVKPQSQSLLYHSLTLPLLRHQKGGERQKRDLPPSYQG